MLDTGGASPALVLIPGIPGRWEWLAPTIAALENRHRVLSFSLSERTSGVDPGVGTPGSTPEVLSPFDNWVALIDAMLDRAAASRATLVGVSFGGLVAARYAARRPDRTSALVLVSAPSPHWRVDARTATYMRYPRLAMSALVARSFARLGPEVIAAKANWPARLAFGAQYAARALRTPASPTDMAGWVEGWMATDIAADCTRITAPTLVVTGEAGLDRVVPVASTLDYQALIPGARHAVLSGTGHIGVVTKPREFADLVTDFADASRAVFQPLRHHAS